MNFLTCLQLTLDFTHMPPIWPIEHPRCSQATDAIVGMSVGELASHELGTRQPSESIASSACASPRGSYTVQTLRGAGSPTITFPASARVVGCSLWRRVVERDSYQRLHCRLATGRGDAAEGRRRTHSGCVERRKPRALLQWLSECAAKELL